MKKSTMAMVLAVMTFSSAALAGCGSNKSAGEATSGAPKVAEVKIGSVHPISGSSAVEGQQMQDAIQLAIDEANQKGGIKSLGGAKVTLVTGDHEGKPEKGVSEVQRMVREGVVGILGTYASGVTLTATQEAEKQKTPFIVTISSVDTITERGFKYTFRLQPPGSMMAQDFVTQFKGLNEKAGGTLKTAVISYEESVNGTSIANYLEKHAGEAGLEIVGKMPHPASTADLTSDVSKMKALNPDVVIPVTYLSDGKLLFQAMKNAGFQPKAVIGIANGAISNAKFITEDTALNQYMMDVNYSINPKNDKAKAVADAYKAKFNKDLGPNAAYSYEAAKVLIDAIERAGSTDKTKVRDALAATNYKDHILPQDAIVFDEKGQNKNAKAVLNQIAGGKSLVVAPEQFKQADVVIGK